MINNLSDALAFIKKSKLEKAAKQPEQSTSDKSPAKKPKATTFDEDDDFFAFPDDPSPKKIDKLLPKAAKSTVIEPRTVSSTQGKAAEKTKKDSIETLDLDDLDFDDIIFPESSSPFNNNQNNLNNETLNKTQNLDKNPSSKDNSQQVQSSLDRLRTKFKFGSDASNIPAPKKLPKTTPTSQDNFTRTSTPKSSVAQDISKSFTDSSTNQNNYSKSSTPKTPTTQSISKPSNLIPTPYNSFAKPSTPKTPLTQDLPIFDKSVSGLQINITKTPALKTSLAYNSPRHNQSVPTTKPSNTPSLCNNPPIKKPLDSTSKTQHNPSKHAISRPDYSFLQPNTDLSVNKTQASNGSTHRSQNYTPHTNNSSTQSSPANQTLKRQREGSEKTQITGLTSLEPTNSSRKRPPGPAGYFARVQPGDSKKDSSDRTKEVQGRFFFQTTSWPLFLRYHDLKESLEWEKKPIACVISSNIKDSISVHPVCKVLKGTFNTKLRVPGLAVTIVRVVEQDLHAQVMFADPSGEISGSAACQIFQKNPQFVEPGVVWILKDVSLICPDSKIFHINVVTSNLVQIFPVNHSPYDDFSNYSPISFTKLHREINEIHNTRSQNSPDLVNTQGRPKEVVDDPIQQILSQNLLDNLSDFSD